MVETAGALRSMQAFVESDAVGPQHAGGLRRAVVLGATGMVGRELVRALLEHPGCASVATVTRRDCEFADDRVERHVVDFERLAEVSEVFHEADAVFSCLGTTLREQGGDRESFRRVDLEYPLEAARLAAEAGARHFLFVSSVEADPEGLLFQSRIKGELEAALAEIPLARVTALQPSVLDGKRDVVRRDERLFLHVLRLASPLLRGSRRAYRPIRVADLVREMIRAVEGLAPASHLRTTSLR